MTTAIQVWRDYVTDGVPSSGAHQPAKTDVRSWGTNLETLLAAVGSGGGKLYQNKAAMDADLVPAANTSALVTNDATASNNGLYRKVGGTGTGSWAVALTFIPGAQIVAAADAGAGTANAITATSSLPISASDGVNIIVMNVFDANTATPVTVTFNGGSALTMKTAGGNDIPVGGLTAGALVAGVIAGSGTQFKLFSDFASGAALDAAVAAAIATAIAAINAAEASSISDINAAEASSITDINAARDAAIGALGYTTEVVDSSVGRVVIDPLLRVLEQTPKADGAMEFGTVRVLRSFNGMTNVQVNEMASRIRPLLRSTTALRPVFPFDDNIILISGQSNSEDADAVPILQTAGRNDVVMLDTTRPRHWSGSFGSTITPALGAETISGTTHWGGDMAPQIGATLMDLVALENNSTFKQHRKRIVPVHIGLSSSAVSGFSYGTAHFTRIVEHLTALKAASLAQGRTIGIIAGVWLWGANGYDLAISKATWKTNVNTYWTTDIDTHITVALFGQRPGAFPVGFFQTAAHGPRGYPDNPYGAEAELELVAENDRYYIINPEGPFFYNGADRGLAGSGVHHSAREAAICGAHIGWWVKKTVLDLQQWPTHLPAITRVSSSLVHLTLADLPSSHSIITKPSGLTPLTSQPNHGLFFYDPAARTTEIALARAPLASGNVIVCEIASGSWPTNLSVRYSARSSTSTLPGNFTIVPDDDVLLNTVIAKGQTIPLYRYLPTFDRVVPA